MANTKAMTNEEVLTQVMYDKDPNTGEAIPIGEGRLYFSRAKGSTNPAVVLESVLSYNTGKNEFLEDLINRIGETVVSGLTFDNPLKKFKKRALAFGDTVQDIYVGRVKRHDWDPEAGVAELFSKEEPDLSVCYHKVNRKDHYDVTITIERLREAFTEEYGLSALISYITAAPVTSNEIDEYEYTKKLLQDNLENTYVMPIDDADGGLAKGIQKTIKKLSKQLRFVHNEYNRMGSDQVCPLEQQALMLNIDTSVDIDMDYLAALYHLDKGSIENKINEVDTFLEPDILGYMTDERAIQIRDYLIQSESQRNAANLSTKMFLHVWELFGYSLYGTLIAFASKKAAKFQQVSITQGQENASIVNGASVYAGSMCVIKVKPGKIVSTITYGPSGTGSSIKIDSTNNQAGVYNFPMPAATTQVQITYAN